MMMMITSTMPCFYLLVLVVVVAATTTTTASKSGHTPPPPRKPITLQLRHWSHLDNSSYESYIQSRLRDQRRDWEAAKRMRTKLLQQQQHQNITYGQEKVISDLFLPLSSPFGKGQYLVELGIGNPRTVYQFLLDSGSLLSWLQCEPCERCYEQKDPIYEPTRSQGFRKVLDSEALCEDLDDSREDAGPNGECMYLVEYEDETSTEGYLITDRLTLEPDGEPFDNVPIGCSTGSDPPKLGGKQAGIVALSRGPLSLLSVLGLQSLCYCLVDPGNQEKESTLVLNPKIPVNPAFYTIQLLSRGPQRETFFYVDLRAIAVNGEMLDIPEEAFKLQPDNDEEDTGVIFDSGTRLTYFPQEVYRTLSDAFARQTKAPEGDQIGDYELCFDIKDLPKDHNYVYPKLSYFFDDKRTEVSLDVRAYIDLSVDDETDCFSIIGHDNIDSVIGLNQQYGNEFFFDLVKNEVTVIYNDCI